MFGYVRIRKPELLVKDYECYQGFLLRPVSFIAGYLWAAGAGYADV